MSSQSTKPARGMRDFLPADVRRRAYAIRIIAEVYERYGFEPLETPAVENLETLMGKYGDEGNQLIFRVQKRGAEFEKAVGERLAALLRQRETPHATPGTLTAALERQRYVDAEELADLALRYDLTVPLARVVAEYRAQLPKFFKRYQIQPVWRADRPARGRFREFYQCDVDVLGSRAMVVEAELCAAVSEVLGRLGFADFVLRLNHRQILNGVLDAAGVSADRAGEALVALDKLDKIGRDGVDKELQERDISGESAAKLLGLFEQVGGAAASAGVREMANDDVLRQLGAFVGDHAAGQRGIAELRDVLGLAASTPAVWRIVIDPSLARGLSYYTGAIMEITVPDLAGSLGGGGRYDNLVGMFLGQDVPACGFSLGLERIIVVMTERGMFPAGLDGAPADVMVTLWNADRIGPALALAHELRTAGIRVDVYPEPDKIGKQFKYASSRGIRIVAVLGDDEIAAGTVAIKDMQSGEQRIVPRADAPRAIKPA
jgi:histidyl-tRNA synthetase